MDSLTGITPRNHTSLNEGFSCLLQKVIKQSDSLCLTGQRVVCVNSLIHLVRSRCVRLSRQRQCLSDLILCEVAVSQIHEKIGKW